MYKKQLIIILSLLFIVNFYWNYNIYVEPNVNIIKKCSNEYKWIGNTLVGNCGFSYRDKFDSNLTLLFMGDSQSRRLAMNVALFSKGVTDNVIHGTDKVIHGRMNRLFDTDISFQWAPCINNAIQIIKKEPTNVIIIYSTSLHYTNGECVKRNFTSDFHEFTMQGFSNVIWRIQPDARQDGLKNAMLVNNSSLRILDQYTIMTPRMYGKNRIKGNTIDHFGLDGRIALAQHLWYNLHNI